LSAESTPALSVVVVVGPLRERAGPCLRSLLEQQLDGGLEILLVDCAVPEFAAVPVEHADDPRVRRVRVDPATTFARARARGVREARAPRVAFLEEHCRVTPGWATAVVEALDRGYAGVSYAFLHGNPGVGISDLSNLTSYSAFLHPTERRESRMLSGHNAAFRRDALLAFGDRLDVLLECDLVLHELLCRAGHKLLVEPTAVVAHLNEATVRARATGLFHFNRIYAPLRAREFGWSLWRRAFYVLAAPALPPYALRCHLRQLSRAEDRALLWRNLPIYFAVMWAAAWGQSLGLLFGPGDSPAAFTRFENSEPRPES
jgi:hypothetical protein